MKPEDDLTLETLLERLPADPEPWRLAETATSADEERRMRAWVELAGLLGTTCPEDAPSVCRERILAAVREREDRPGIAGEGGGAEVVAIPPNRQGSGPVAERPAPARAVWALAAALGACCLALAFFAGRWMEQGERIETLEARSAVATPDPDPATAEAAEIRRLRDRLRMVTTVARYAYPLEPAGVGGERIADRADGVVYVCGAHQQWYLALEGLEPAPQGQEYRLWFLTDEGPRSGGRLEAREGEPVELEASTLPKGTHGFSVTLEPSDGADDEPHGRMVLLSEDSVSL